MKPPIVVIHGGPGMTHDYLLELQSLAGERQVIFYDQIGNGLSSPVGKEAAEFVSLQFMCGELKNLLGHLEITSDYSLFAHSAGGCIALEHALSKPKGLRSLILANAFSSAMAMQRGLRHWRDQLPSNLSHALTVPETGVAPGDSNRALAMQEFFMRHICRVPPPEHLLATLTASMRFPEVQQKQMGADLFEWDGELANWSASARLGEIRVPTFAYGGRWDEAHPDCLRAFADRLPNCRTITFEASSHVPHIEEKEVCLGAIAAFLDEVDRFC